MTPQTQIAESPHGKLAQALDLAKRGFYVFPLEENSKLPAIDGWPRRASRDADQIKRWWHCPVTDRELDRNIGIYTGRYRDDNALLVIDVDVKNGAPGEDSLRALQEEHETLPPTRTVSTPTGGRHLYFVVDEPVKQGVHVLGHGIDVRSRGGFVVAPGSTVEAGAYETTDDIAPLVAPRWLVAKCPRGPVECATKPQTTPATDLDTEGAIKQATRYLTTEAPLPVMGGRSDTTYRVAAHVKDLGVSVDAAIELMTGHWEPRWQVACERDDFEATIRHAYRYGQEAPGAKSPAAEFTAVEGEVIAMPEPRPALYFESFRDVEPELKRRGLIKGVIDEAAMSVIYGESNAGKTFFVTDMGLHIARGLPWFGRRTLEGLVVYVAAEAGGSMKRRIKAYKVHHDLAYKDVPFALVPCPVDLLKPSADTQPLIDLVREAQKRFGKRPLLVVIDTLARALAGGNENASDDMGAFVRNVDRIRTATGAHVAIVHHSGKDKAKGARGHSSLRAATDTEIELSGGIARVTKQRDFAGGQQFGFGIVEVPLGTDEDGDPVTSAVLVPVDLAAMQADAPNRQGLTDTAKEALAILDGMAEQTGDPMGRVSFEAWRNACKDAALVAGVKPTNERQQFSRAKTQLVRKGIIGEPTAGSVQILDNCKA